jgi:hypothetical protein
MRGVPSIFGFAFAQSFVNVGLIVVRRNLPFEALTKRQRVTADFIAHDDAAKRFMTSVVAICLPDFRISGQARLTSFWAAVASSKMRQSRLFSTRTATSFVP